MKVKVMHKIYEKFFNEKYAFLSEVTKKKERYWLNQIPLPNELTKQWIIDFLVPYSPATRKRYLARFRQLFRWLDRIDEISDIRIPKVPLSVSPDDLYTKEELENMLIACANTQERAMLEVLYETAVRASELLSMDLDSVVFESAGVSIMVKVSKTFTRAIPIQESVPSLREWLNVHPLNKDKSSPLWITHKSPYDRLKYNGLYHRVLRLLNDANIKGKTKIIHLFRHSRLTELARLGVSEHTMRSFAGWEVGSNMSRIYVHLSGRDAMVEIRTKVHGVKSIPLPEPLMKSRKCPRCHTDNPSTAVRCSKCSAPLIIDEIESLVDEKIKALLDKGGFVKTKDGEGIYWYKRNKKKSRK